MSYDLTSMLQEWKYDGENTVRLVTADDGRQVMQVRLPLGVEQYELDGRPDGDQPFGRETALDEYQFRLEAYREQHGTDSGFAVDHDDFLVLQNEGLLYYYRYLLLFQIGDYERTVEDTHHNLALCEFIESYCQDTDDRASLLQYRPYILRMHAISRAMISLHQHLKQAAKDILQTAIDQIQTMPEVETAEFRFERVRSLNYLRSALKQVEARAIDPVDKLNVELRRAVEDENYELAAELRDKIRQLQDDSDD
jgi:hypothetical protein